MNTAEIRKKIIADRALWPEHLRELAGKEATKHLLAMPQFAQAKTVMCFLSFGDEIDTKEICQAVWQQGKTLVVPKTFKGFRLEVYKIENFEGLIPGRYDILEPDPKVHELVDPKEIDFIVMPGVAFDSKGDRVGYGAGFYDRFLLRTAEDTLKVAFSFRMQWVPELIAQPHDQKMDFLVNESGLTQF